MAETESPSTPGLSKPKVNYSEVQETVNRLAAHKGVTAVLILNRAGDILTQTGNGAVGNPKLLKQTLDAAARYIQSIPSDDNDNNNTAADGDEDGTLNGSSSSMSTGDLLEKLNFVRIRGKREEILVAPKNHYVLVVIQDPTIAPL